jgi:hypothetical protein
MAMPTSAATTMAVTNCHDFHDRLPLIWSSPGAGIGSDAPPEDDGVAGCGMT